MRVGCWVFPLLLCEAPCVFWAIVTFLLWRWVPLYLGHTCWELRLPPGGFFHWWLSSVLPCPCFPYPEDTLCLPPSHCFYEGVPQLTPPLFPCPFLPSPLSSIFCFCPSSLPSVPLGQINLLVLRTWSWGPKPILFPLYGLVTWIWSTEPLNPIIQF